VGDGAWGTDTTGGVMAAWIAGCRIEPVVSPLVLAAAGVAGVGLVVPNGFGEIGMPGGSAVDWRSDGAGALTRGGSATGTLS